MNSVSEASIVLPENITFLGLGAMGQRMAERLQLAGHAVRGWNRTAAPALGSGLGCDVARDPCQAVAESELVFAMLTDDAASREVWLGPAGALSAVRPGATCVECSTLSPAWVGELADRMKQAKVEFVEAPVVGSRPQAAAGSLVFLTGGELSAIERIRPVLSCMGGTVHHVGAPPAGAYTKLAVNALFGVQVAVLAELLGFASSAGLDPASLLSVLESLPVLSGAGKLAAAGMLKQQFEPMFPVDLVAKDFRYALAAATAAGCSMPVAGSAAEVFEAGRERGFGKENLTAVAKLYPS